IDLIGELKTRLKEWAGFDRADVRRLSSRFAIVVAFPVAECVHHNAGDLRAFLTYDTAGEIGVALGSLLASESQVGDKRAYVVAIPERASSDRVLRVEPAQLHFALDRKLAATVAGHVATDLRRAVLVGAGSLGSQLSVDLAREGVFAWTVV